MLRPQTFLPSNVTKGKKDGMQLLEEMYPPHVAAAVLMLEDLSRRLLFFLSAFCCSGAAKRHE